MLLSTQAQFAYQFIVVTRVNQPVPTPPPPVRGRCVQGKRSLWSTYHDYQEQNMPYSILHKYCTSRNMYAIVRRTPPLGTRRAEPPKPKPNDAYRVIVYIQCILNLNQFDISTDICNNTVQWRLARIKGSSSLNYQGSLQRCKL